MTFGHLCYSYGESWAMSESILTCKRQKVRNRCTDNVDICNRYLVHGEDSNLKKWSKMEQQLKSYRCFLTLVMWLVRWLILRECPSMYFWGVYKCCILNSIMSYGREICDWWMLDVCRIHWMYVSEIPMCFCWRNRQMTHIFNVLNFLHLVIP